MVVRFDRIIGLNVSYLFFYKTGPVCEKVERFGNWVNRRSGCEMYRYIQVRFYRSCKVSMHVGGRT